MIISALSTFLAQNTPPAETIFGKLSPPPGVDKYNKMTGDPVNGIGILIFLTYAIRLSFIGAGIYVMFNFLLAGYTFINSGGEAKAYTQAKDSLTMSVIGLVIMISAYTAISLLSLVFFGDATFIINPKISGPTP